MDFVAIPCRICQEYRALHDTYFFREKLILVMGMQRSGTTAFLHAIEQDPSVRAEDESENGPFHDQFKLRPLKDMFLKLLAISRRVALKAVVDVPSRSIEEILREFERLKPLVIWLYRDPANVWSSTKLLGGLSDEHMPEWMARWVEANQYALAARRGPFGDRLAIVRYEDLIFERNFFDAVCDFLGLDRCNNSFRPADPGKGRQLLMEECLRAIAQGTSPTLAELDAARFRRNGARLCYAGTRFYKPPRQLSELGPPMDVRDLVLPESLSHCELELRDGACAELEDPGDGTISIRIQSLPTPSLGAVQATMGYVNLQEGREYVLLARGRSPHHRPIAIACSTVYELGHPVDAWLPLYFDREWRSGHLIFKARNSGPARVCAFAGEDRGEVQFEGVAVFENRGDGAVLHAHGDALCELDFPTHDLDHLLIRTTSTAGRRPDSVQVEFPIGPVVKGRRYRVRFHARALDTEFLRVSLQRRSSPWTAVGSMHDFAVFQSWTTFYAEVTCNENCDDARVVCDIGLFNSIEIDRLRCFLIEDEFAMAEQQRFQEFLRIMTQDSISGQANELSASLAT